MMDSHHLLEVAGILAAGVLFHSLAYGWFSPGSSRRRPLWIGLLGLFWGGIAVVLMISRIRTGTSVYVDGRVLPIALVGLFEGGWAGLVAALPAVAYRVWLGGAGAPAGVVTVLAVALAAWFAHRWAGGTARVRVRHAFVLGVGTFLITAGGFELLGARGRAMFSEMWPSYLLLTVVGLPTLSLLMGSIVERRVLAEERERFRAVLDETTDAIRLVDAETGRILDCNRADCELSGLTREQLLGRDAREFWPDPAPAPAPERAASAVRRGEVTRAQGVPFRTADGRVLTVDCTRRIVGYQARRYEIVIYRDAGERVAGDEARREAATLRSVNLLAQAAAHEINNPLAIIMGYSQMLEDRLPAGSEEGGWARTCRTAGGRIRDAVARLSHIVRIEPTQSTGSLPPILDTERSSAPDRDPGR